MLLAIASTIGCEKDKYPAQKPARDLPEASALSSRYEGTLTVLGNRRTIPYKVDIMLQAYNELYEPDIAQLLPNHLYVRFLPHSPQDVKKLLDSGFEFWDFPLDFDIVSFGEKYHDPSVSDSSLTWQYAVVPVNTDLPDVQHEVLESLALVPEDCALAQKAFSLAGVQYQASETLVADLGIVDGSFDFFPAPKYEDDPDGGTGTGPGERGDCDCPLPEHSRHPSGCVQVEDNMLHGYEGVKEVEVIMAKIQLFGLVFHQKTQTDYSGCWEINHKYHGSIHVWVRFSNSRCDVKTMDAALDLWGYSFPRRAYIGSFGGPNFNNLPIRFDHTTAIGSSAFRNWVAATVNNSVYEFSGYTSSKGILGSVPDNLKIVVTPWGNDNTGSAPMLDKMSVPQQLLTYNPVNIIVGIIGLRYPVVGAFILPFVGWVEAVAPDIALNVGDVTEVNADDIRETLYHELAHAMHFEKVGDNYWRENIFYTVSHLGYGDGTASGAGRCSVIESWGFMTGRIAAHQRYGTSNSNIGNPDNNTWRARLEREFSWPVQSNVVHIPWGWEWDIQDNNTTNPGNEDENILVASVGDNVSGFTSAQIFSKMSASVQSMAELKTALLPYLPSGVSVNAYNTLAEVYGF